MQTLSYQNEDDRAYGLAGMTVSASLMGALEMISDIDLDRDGAMVRFSHSYFFGGSPAASPKATWAHTLRTYQLTTAMALGNIFSRALVRLHEDVSDELLNQIKELADAEGRDACSLEDDEIEEIFGRVLGYSRRIYGNPRMHPAIDRFADIISRRRALSHLEMCEALQSLGVRN